MKPREMLFSHRYAEAAKVYKTQLESKPDDSGLLSAHAIAMLALGRYEEALKGSRRANAIANAELKGETQPYIERIGSILWLLGRRDEAIQTFQSGVDGIINGSIKYADNAGGVSHGLLLWYAAVSADNVEASRHALNYLGKLAKKSRIDYWPGALALYVIGAKLEEDVILEVCGARQLHEAFNRAKNDLLVRRRLAQSLFYFATREREKGHKNQCQCGMVQCASLENPILENEWYLACAEVKGSADQIRK
jgi:tetratricopeptide (TPR) repeat protein